MTQRTKQGVSVVRFESRHLEDTLTFLTKWSPDHPELGDRALFEWQRCDRWLALFKGEIVGHIARIPHTLKAFGRSIEIGWGATLVLDTSNPLIQTFAGTALLDQVTKRSSLPFGGVGIVPEIAETHKKRGYKIHADAVCMYARFFRPATALEYYQKPAIFSLPIRGVNLVRPAWCRRTGECKRLDRFDPAWDEAWDKLLAKSCDIYGERTADYLNYKLDQPGKDYIAYVHADTSGALDGYIIFRRAAHGTRKLRLVKVVDLVGTRSAKRALLAEAIAYARGADVDGIVSLSATADRHVFSRCGLWLRRAFPVVLPPELDGRIHISFFDSDLDNLW